MHHLVRKYLEDCTTKDNIFDKSTFCTLISNAYNDMDRYRKRNARALSAIITENNDLTERLTHALGALKLQNSLLSEALNGSDQAVLIYDNDDKLVFSNETFSTFFDAGSKTYLKDSDFSTLVHHLITPKLASPAAGLCDITTTLAMFKAHDQASLILETHDARFIEMRLMRTQALLWHIILKDITETRHSHNKLDWLSTHDSLTDLPNRSAFIQALDDHLHFDFNDVGTSHHLAVISVDIENLGGLNERYGFAVGDGYLRALAAHLSGLIGPSDVLARIDGDEFAIIAHNVASIDDVLALTHKILACAVEPFAHPANKDQLIAAPKLSLGIALAPHDGKDSQSLMKKAELALHSAKAEVPGTYRLFDSQMDIRLHIRRSLEDALVTGLKDDQFELYYQPLVDLSESKIFGAEALLRWNHPQNGFISPLAFVPLAEETGLICDIGAWVLKKACLEAMHWPQDLKVSVNLSPVQFYRQDVVKAVEEALSQSGLCASRLELEITESVLLEHNESTMETLSRLRDMGVKISLDDFGTGYSSLNYLRSFAFDKIKIDRSFISGITLDAQAVNILKSLVQLGQNLGIDVLAEGIETKEQQAVISDLGCHLAQGYLYAKPLKVSDFKALISEENQTLQKLFAA